jgi:hypothetical protein
MYFPAYMYVSFTQKNMCNNGKSNNNRYRYGSAILHTNFDSDPDLAKSLRNLYLHHCTKRKTFKAINTSTGPGANIITKDH